jgi:photosystem II stability/assembly factor-like uncharacterized protein
VKRSFHLFAVLALLVAGASVAGAVPRPSTWAPHEAGSPAAIATAVDDDPDMPGALGQGGMDKATYMQARENYFKLRWDAPFDVAYNGRIEAIAQMQKQSGQMAPFAANGYWTAIGPFPIPNGQTTTIATPVSGRITAIVVHPTNPNIVYIGAAQGGVWRTLDGGANWTPIFDNAASLAVGALALAPSNPSILYVGTGEANLSADSFFGVGLYRIDNADTAPVLNGPFNPTPTNDVIGAKTFTGRSISQILVNPTDPATIFVSTGSGVGGMSADAFGASPPITALRGIFRSTNGTSGSPSFTKLTVLNQGSIAPDVTGNRIVTDMAFDPTDATWNTLVCWVYGAVAAADGGIWRTTNAMAAAPTFVQTFTSPVSIRGAFTVNRVSGVTTMIVATGETATGTSCTTGSGCLRRSTDGGVTWSAKLTGGGGFCGGQCWYDCPVAVSPTNASIILIGGAGNSTCSRVYARSTDGGATFSGAGGADVGLHADAHAIAFAPSNTSIVYEGNDGGIFKSTDGGATWASLNNGISATQFESIATHPIDPNFTIGGTQDNGTNWYRPNATWTRADYGDGGFALIDQNAVDNTNVTMYHTYYNQTNSLLAIARVTTTASAVDGGWIAYGCGGNISNGIGCANTVLFYAPITLGPGNPNTVYYGSDRLYRSINKAATMTVVSQAPIVSGVPISAICIAPQSDNVRVVGLTNGQVWRTMTGSSALVNISTGLPGKYVTRIAIDPTNSDVCYVTLGGFGLAAGAHVWKTTNLSAATPVWNMAGNLLPDVPVNSIVIDPTQTTHLWAGGDVGVYESTDAGATWAPYTTGMPVVSVFDMSFQAPNRILRVATHGRGMYERLVDAPVATQLALVGAEIVDGHPQMTWYSADGANERMNLYRRAVPGDFELVGPLVADGSGMITYTDSNVEPGHSYEYQIGLVSNGVERRLGSVWVDVPMGATFGLRRIADAGKGPLQFSVTLTSPAPARLELMDVTGRRVASQELSGLAMGEHRVQLDASARPGIYWARLSQAGKMVSTKVALVR